MPKQIQAIEEELCKLEKADFIKPSESPYALPIVCVSKLDGSLRVCINFRKVNKDIVFDSYPMYKIDKQLENMAGARFFTTLNLTKSYHQRV